MAKVEGKKFNAPPQYVKDREKDRERMKMKAGYRERRLWIFLAWGIVVVVFGLVAGGVYLNLRAITSTEKYTEVIPTYANSLAVILSGVMVLVLFWKRNIILVFGCVFTNIIAAFINGIAAILSGTLIIPPIQKVLHCTFLELKRECHCLSPYRRSVAHLEYSVKAPVTLVFKETSSCHTIEVTLLQILYALCGICVVSSVLCIISAILSLLVMKMERKRKKVCQNDTYDEIFTISNSNTPETSDSENEHNGILTHPMLPSYTGLDVTPSETSMLRSSLQRTQSLKQPCTTSNNLNFIDNSAQKQTISKGKLKEHRRRDRRAVTLSNLDSKQLMLILSLQMRYMKESDNSKSQVELSAKKLDEQLQRSFTPQPYHLTSRSCESEKDIRRVRSHTPQPYQMAREQQMYENLQQTNITEFYENNIPLWEQSQSKLKRSTQNDKISSEKKKYSQIPHYEEIDDVTNYFSGKEDENTIYAIHQDIKSQKKARPKLCVDSEESEQSDIPTHSVCRSHRRAVPERNLPNNIPVSKNSIPNPAGRPKSYINAIDNPDPKPDDMYSQVHKTESKVYHAQSHPNHLNHHEFQTLCTRPPLEGIYAQPVKVNPSSTFQRIPDSCSVPVIGRQQTNNNGDRRSAFQVVRRSSEAGTGIVEYIDHRTNHNYAMYSVMDKKKGNDAPPPYSPPPCYSDCLTNARDSSLKPSLSKVDLPKPKFIYANELSRPLISYVSNDFNAQGSISNCSESPCYDGGVVYGNIDVVPRNRKYSGSPQDNQHSQFSSPIRTNYEITFDQEQPQVALYSESSDSDEMETVI